MKHLIIAGAAIAIAAAVGLVSWFAMNNPPATNPAAINEIDLSLYKNGENIFITPEDLLEKLLDKNLVILDGNHPKIYAKGHIPGAINIGFKGLSGSQGKPGDAGWGTILPPEDLKAKLESFGITKESLIVCYSDTFKGPGAGGRAVWQQRMAGLDNVRLLYGGMSLWRQAGYELTREIPQITPSAGLVLQPYNENYRADLHFVSTHLDKLKIIDVRSKREYSGDDTSRGEARGGHIKNAEWLEWTTLLNPDSTPKSSKEIIALLAAMGVNPDDDFVLY